MREGPLADLFRSTTPGEGGAQGLQSESPAESRQEVPMRTEGHAVVRVVGVGGGGCNAVDRMIEAGVHGGHGGRGGGGNDNGGDNGVSSVHHIRFA